MSSYVLDPDAVLDYAFDWTPWLAAGETIDTKTIVASTGITVDSSSIDGGIVTVWVSGAVGPRERVTCRITTNQGRTDDRSITLNIRQR